MPKDTREIWVADSETDPFELGVVPEPFIWGIYHGYGDKFYREFTETADLVDFLSKQNVIIYAHNGGKFDWHFLSPWFEAGQELLIINGRLSRFEIGKCEFRDSYNLMPVALEQYQKQEIDYNKMHRLVRHRYMDEIREYLKSDCVNLWNMVYGFDATYGRHITQASAAMHFWKYRLSQRMKVPRSDDNFYDTFAPFYYGGRVQCFEFGDIHGNFQSIDINSAYPYAMLSEHPYSLEYRLIPGKPKQPESEWGPILFVIDAIAHGCFPLRGTDKSLYYPDDSEERRYFVTGWELQAAIETGTVESIKFLQHYKFVQLQDFREYVYYFWNLRQQFKVEGNKGGEFYCKIFLNALYGKFGMDPRKFKEYTLQPNSKKSELIAGLQDGESIQDFREWCIYVVNGKETWKGFYNLATAASITGYVRALLWRAVCGATRPIYCDTDSVTAESFGPEITLSSQLGDWDLESEFDRCVIAGKKLYAMHIKNKPVNRTDAWKVASKGARLTYRDLISLASGERVRYDNIVPTFSASKAEPRFISRDIVATAKDIRTVPRSVDPKFNNKLDDDEEL